MSDVKKLIYQKIEPRKKIDGGNPLLLFLHGRGTDENDLLGLAPYVDERFLIVSARAPFQFQWGPGYAWYDIEQVGAPDAEKFPVSRDSIVGLIDEIVRDSEVNNKKLYLLGFSMGAVMASAVALTYPDKIAGVVAHSGYIAEGEDIRYRWDNAKDAKFFVAHGTLDPVISVEFGRRAETLLKEHGIDHTYKEYEMGHQISQESLTDATGWLTEQLNK
jgi:phospholipase/carboxylesterase